MGLSFGHAFDSTPVPKAGVPGEVTLLFSALLLKKNNLGVIAACGWLCANVPICLMGGHKSWHNRGQTLDRAQILLGWFLATLDIRRVTGLLRRG